MIQGRKERRSLSLFLSTTLACLKGGLVQDGAKLALVGLDPQVHGPQAILHSSLTIQLHKRD